MQSKQIAIKELVIKYLTGESGQAERRRVEMWIKKDAENKRYFDEIEFLWRASGTGKEMSEVF